MDGPHLPSIFFIKDAFRKRKVFSDVNHLVPYWAKIVKTFTFILSSPSIFLTAFPALWWTLSPSQGFFQSVASLRRWYNLLFYCRNGRFSKCVTVQAVTETRDGTNSLTLQRTNKLVSRAAVCQWTICELPVRVRVCVCVCMWSCAVLQEKKRVSIIEYTQVSVFE